MCRQRLRLGLDRRHEGLGVVHHDEPAESGAGEGRNVNEVAQGSGIPLKRSTPDIARGRRAGAAWAPAPRPDSPLRSGASHDPGEVVVPDPLQLADGPPRRLRIGL